MNIKLSKFFKMVVSSTGKLMTVQTPPPTSHEMRTETLVNKIQFYSRDNFKYNSLSRLFCSFSFLIDSVPGYVQNHVDAERDRLLFVAVVLGIFSDSFINGYSIDDLHPLIFNEIASLFHKDHDWLNEKIESVQRLISADYRFKTKVDTLRRSCLKDVKQWLHNPLMK